MRRLTDGEIVRKNGWLLAGAGVFLFVGILLCVAAVFFAAPAREDLQETTGTVRYVRHSIEPHAHDDYLKTTDGTVYRISGSYQRETIKEQLPEGAAVTVRWYRHFPTFRLFAEEVCVDGVWVVTYNNTKADRIAPLIVGVFVLALGTGCAFLFRYTVRHDHEKQAQRDRRIQRKYGSKPKR